MVRGKRELATLDKNRRAVGMLNPMRDKNEGTYRGGEGMTPVTTACLAPRRVKPPTWYELSWNVKVTINTYTFQRFHSLHLFNPFHPFVMFTLSTSLSGIVVRRIHSI